jgi:hypothetical protein
MSENFEKFIIASDPNYENINDFIRLIFEKHVSVVVSLSSVNIKFSFFAKSNLPGGE